MHTPPEPESMYSPRPAERTPREPSAPSAAGGTGMQPIARKQPGARRAARSTWPQASGKDATNLLVWPFVIKIGRRRKTCGSTTRSNGPPRAARSPFPTAAKPNRAPGPIGESQLGAGEDPAGAGAGLSVDAGGHRIESYKGRAAGRSRPEFLLGFADGRKCREFKPLKELGDHSPSGTAAS